MIESAARCVSCAIKQARAIAAIIGREEERNHRQAQDRESQGDGETARHRGTKGRPGKRERRESGRGGCRALTASIQQAPATLNSAGPGSVGQMCVRPHSLLGRFGMRGGEGFERAQGGRVRERKRLRLVKG